MKKEMQIKSHVLDLLEEMLMGGSSSKFKPKVVSVEVIKGKPGEGLEDVLDKASKNEYGREPLTEDEGDIDQDGDHDIHDHALEKEAEMYEDAKEGEMEDEDEEEKKPRMSLRDFLNSR